MRPFISANCVCQAVSAYFIRIISQNGNGNGDILPDELRFCQIVSLDTFKDTGFRLWIDGGDDYVARLGKVKGVQKGCKLRLDCGW